MHASKNPFFLKSQIIHTKQLVYRTWTLKIIFLKRQFFWLYESEAIFSFGHLLKSAEVVSSLSARLKWKYQACSFCDWNGCLCAWLARSFHSGEGARSGTRNIVLWKVNNSLFKPAAWWHRCQSRAAVASWWARQTDLWGSHESSLCWVLWILPGWLCCPEWSTLRFCLQQYPPQSQHRKDQMHGWGQMESCTGGVACAPHLSKRSVCGQMKNWPADSPLLPTNWYTRIKHTVKEKTEKKG